MALLAGSAVSLTAGGARADTGAPPVVTDPEAVASAQAQATGQSVPVDADTTTTSTTVANADGTFTYTAGVLPVRVKHGSGWVPVDATLTQAQDGSWSPKAAESGVTFSGGGSAALATLTNSQGQRISVSWPSALPTPTVSGATATYSEVYPGVDLQMTATTDGGYTEHLVVTTATAAANPALADIHLNTAVSTGLSLSRNSAGGLQATDSTGAVAFSSPTATMWSAGTPGSTLQAAARTLSAQSTTDTTAQDAGNPVTALTVNVSSSGVDLIPPSGALTASTNTYPLVIDPSLSPSEPGWAWISSQTPNTSYWQGTNNTHDTYAHVGYDDWCSDGTSGCTAFQKTRSLFSLDMTGLLGKHVTAATLSVTEQGPTSSLSGTRQIDLHSGGGFDSGTTWNNASISSSVAANANFSSITTNTAGNANFGVTALVQNAVSSGYHTQTMVLEASNESDDTAYRYLHGTVQLGVTYWSTPNVPTNLSTSAAGSGAGKACDTTAPGMWINKNDGNSVTLHASLTGPDSGYPEDAEYWYRQFAPTTDPSWTEEPLQTVTAQSTAQPTQVTLPPIADGSEYEWDVYAKVDTLAYTSTAAPSATTACWFRTDFTAPTVTVATAAGPTGVGATGQLSLTASDAGTNPSGVKEIDYNIDGTSLNSGGSGETAATGSAANFTLPATSWGTHTVWYDTVDNAGNQSAPAHFDYYVPEGTYTPGTVGDLDGDGKPDLTTVDSSGNLTYYSNPFANNPNGTGTHLLKATNAPNGVSFAGALIGHRGSFNNRECDDLVLLQNSNLYVDTADIACSPTGWSFGAGQPRPTSVTGDTTNYNATNWSSVQQMVVLPPSAASNSKPALVTLENDNGVYTVWMYTAVGAQYRSATLLATGSYWSHVTLLSPGLINGSPALWVRDTSTGALLQYPNIETWQGNTTAPTGGTTIAASGYRIGQYPAVTTDGPADNAGPTLWATNHTGQLIDIPTTVGTSGNVTPGTPITVGGPGWAANNQTLDGVRPLHPTTNIGIYRASTEQFSFATANNNATVDHTAVFGQSGDVPLTGDWNGDGIDTIGVYRPSTHQFILSNSSINPTQDITATFGSSGDVPIIGDWNGDGIDTIGVFRPSTRHFYLSDSNTSPAVDHTIWFGTTADQPIVGDWDGDGTTTIGLYRPSTEQYIVANSSTNPTVDATVTYGNSGDTPLTGDWNGDGTTTIGAWRPSAFYLDNSLTSATISQTTWMGISTDIPITGDWNGQ